ncbi:hypothetical protein [Ramlibacter sp. PS4R-6]|uniref:hypothetical protein n=1 Tax=Ramlibacter sp. PS4R-6 TaxID=3133438 RepID=UPI00309D7AA7
MQARQQVQGSERYLLAFEELGLDFHWDGREPVRAYIEREHPQLLRVYDAEFLVSAIESISARGTA